MWVPRASSAHYVPDPNANTRVSSFIKDHVFSSIRRAFCSLRATLESPDLTLWEKAFQCRQFVVYSNWLATTKERLKEITRLTRRREITPCHFQTTLKQSGDRLLRKGASAWDLHQLWIRLEEKLKDRAPPFFIEACQEARARLQEHLRQNPHEAISCFHKGLTYWVIEASCSNSLELSLLHYFREVVPNELYLKASAVVMQLAQKLITEPSMLTPNERQQACKQACRELDRIFFPVSSKVVDQETLQRARRIKSEPFLHLISRVALSYLILQNRSHSSRHSFIGNLIGGAAVGWVSIPGVSAAGTAQGLEFRVNKFEGSSSDLEDPAAALLPNGEVIVVWHIVDQDGVGSLGIFGLKYAPNGTELSLPNSGTGGAVGYEFPVNRHITGHQMQPAIVSLGNGEVVMAWSSQGQDGDGLGVFGKWLHINGTEKIIATSSTGGGASAEFPINTFTTGDQWKPTLAALHGGGFVCAWMSNGQDGDSTGIYGKWFHSNGTERFIPTSGTGGASGAEFRVNTYTPDSQSYPSLSYHDDGGFYATWRGYNPTLGLFDIFAKRFAANGSELTLPTSGLGGATGNEFRVNIYTADIQTSPKIIYHPARGPLITWYSNQQEGSTEAQGIYGIRYNSSGGEVMVPHSGLAGAVGSEFHVNNLTLRDQRYPVAIPLVNGGDVVAWESEDQDGDNLGVFGMMYNADGAEVRVATSGMSGAAGNEFRINTYIWGHQHNIALVPTQDGGFLAFWESGAQLYGKRFAANGTEVPLQTLLLFPTELEPTSPPNTTETLPPSTTQAPVAPVTRGSSGSGTKIIPLVAGLVGGGAGLAVVAAICALVYRKWRSERVGQPYRHSLEPRIREAHENIGGAYDLLKTMSRNEANELKDKTGVDVPFTEGEESVRFNLGVGSFGKTYVARGTRDDNYGDFFAVKIIERDKVEQSKKEAQLQTLFKGHRHIMPLTDTAEVQDTLYHFMPIAGWGNGITFKMQIAQHKSEDFTNRVFAHLAIGFLKGVRALHINKVYHLDLKPENLVIDRNGTPMIIDFGCAVQSESKDLKEFKRGDLHYFSPQRTEHMMMRQQCKCFDAKRADRWAAGVTLFEIATGSNPFTPGCDIELKINEARNQLKVSDALFEKVRMRLNTDMTTTSIVKLFKRMKLHYTSVEESKGGFDLLRKGHIAGSVSAGETTYYPSTYSEEERLLAYGQAYENSMA